MYNVNWKRERLTCSLQPFGIVQAFVAAVMMAGVTRPPKWYGFD
jgi:hypothetical protein